MRPTRIYHVRGWGSKIPTRFSGRRLLKQTRRGNARQGLIEIHTPCLLIGTQLNFAIDNRPTLAFMIS